MSADGTIHVACAAEGAYDRHSAAMLHSVLTQTGGSRVHVHYLHGPGFPARSLELLDRMVDELGGRMSSYAIEPDRVAGLPVVDEFTVAMWFRIFLPELLPREARALYLDIDTLALDSLTHLWETDIEGTYLAAVTNVFMPHHRHRPASIGLSAPERYFNSGVLLLNLDEMRRDGCTEELVRVARERGPQLEWPDQDALNLVLGAKRTPLHPRWNAMNSLRFEWSVDVFGATAVAEARTSPGIRHFEGPGANKPWHADCDRGDRKLYRRHRRNTPWPPSRGAHAGLATLARGARRRLGNRRSAG